MISEFQDLSDKIDRLAELTQSLRQENAQLRQANKFLCETVAEAQRRIEILLVQIPAPDAEDPANDQAEATE
jgi:FtsZ-binding cell division protein ZapB